MEAGLVDPRAVEARAREIDLEEAVAAQIEVREIEVREAGVLLHAVPVQPLADMLRQLRTALAEGVPGIRVHNPGLRRKRHRGAASCRSSRPRTSAWCSASHAPRMSLSCSRKAKTS